MKTRKKKILLPLLLFFFLLSARQGFCQEDPEQISAYKQTEKETTYYFYRPAVTVKSQVVPLFVTIHGAFGKAEGDFARWLPYAKSEGFALLAPQFDEGYDSFNKSENKSLARILSKVIADYHLPKKRNFIFGFSRGATFTQRFIQDQPGFFKACALAAGPEYTAISNRQIRGIRHLILCGSNDQEANLEQAQSLYARLRASGVPAEITILPGLGHGVEVDEEEKVMDFFRKWILGKSSPSHRKVTSVRRPPPFKTKWRTVKVSPV